jgi:stearoyl-CoA desaturase (Delta-9 desaturase)
MTPTPGTATTTRPPVAPTAASAPETEAERAAYGTLGDDRKGNVEQIALFAFIAVPFVAILLAIPVAWGGWLGWSDILVAVLMYAISGHGITVGFHRYLTHGSFKAKRPLRIALAIAGSLAIEGPAIRWVADHRKHHKFSDKEGDPHSPWRYGETVPALMKGLWFAHMGWLFDVEQTSQRQYAPDLMRDPDMVKVSRAFPWLATASLLIPPALGALITMSWHGALTAFFWGSLVRIGLLHHVTWSINSICHAMGERPFDSRDKSGNVWWLAILSMGESWHNLHHADPTCARTGVLKGQIDSGGRLIKWLEDFGWAYDVRWPRPERLAARRSAA